MIIKLTPSEVKNLVGRALGLTGGPIFDLEIVDEETLVLASLRRALTDFPRCSYDQKIAFIKRFRELVGRNARGELLSLAECKWAAENPSAALNNLERDGYLGAVIR